MSLTTLLPPVIVPSIVPRSWMDMALLERPLSGLTGFPLTSLDIFDPFDEIDRQLSSNISWLTQPLALIPEISLVPRVPEKHRISIRVPGIKDESSIKTEVKDNKLIVSAKEGEQAVQEHDYEFHEFKRTFELPKNLDTKNLVTFKSGDTLVCEIPIKQTKKQLDSLVPVIEEGEGGQKKVSLNVVIPDNIDPSKVSVTLKDRDVVIKANYREKKENSDTSVYYMRRSSLPMNTDLNSLKCTAQNGNQLRIEASLGENPNKSVPIKIENLPQIQQPDKVPGQQQVQQSKQQQEQQRQQQREQQEQQRG